MNNEKSIKDLARQISNILDDFGHQDWVKAINEAVEKLNISNDEGKIAFKSLFGGMGSINDIVLYKDGIFPKNENNKFDEIRTDLYKLLK